MSFLGAYVSPEEVAMVTELCAGSLLKALKAQPRVSWHDRWAGARTAGPGVCWGNKSDTLCQHATPHPPHRRQCPSLGPVWHSAGKLRMHAFFPTRRCRGGRIGLEVAMGLHCEWEGLVGAALVEWGRSLRRLCLTAAGQCTVRRTSL